VREVVGRVADGDDLMDVPEDVSVHDGSVCRGACGERCLLFERFSG